MLLRLEQTKSFNYNPTIMRQTTTVLLIAFNCLLTICFWPIESTASGLLEILEWPPASHS